MNRIPHFTAMAAGLFTVVAVAATLPADAGASSARCTVPAAERQTSDALRQKLEAEGWHVRRIKSEDGCFEVYGIDAKGQRVEAYFHPKTFAIVKLNDED